MNIVLWILQVLLALHTVMGAVWKFSHSEQTVPSLKAIPHAVWLGLSGLELLCAVALVLPFLSKTLSVLIPIAAICIAAEMLLFCGLNSLSGAPKPSELIYWLIVAAVCAFIAYGRFVLRPL